MLESFKPADPWFLRKSSWFQLWEEKECSSQALDHKDAHPAVHPLSLHPHTAPHSARTHGTPRGIGELLRCSAPLSAAPLPWGSGTGGDVRRKNHSKGVFEIHDTRDRYSVSLQEIFRVHRFLGYAILGGFQNDTAQLYSLSVGENENESLEILLT